MKFRHLAISMVGVLFGLLPFASGQTEGGAEGSIEAEIPSQSVTFGAAYKGEINRGIRGLAAPETLYLGNLDLSAELNGQRLLGVSGLKGYFDVLLTHGAQPSAVIGDASFSSNIENDHSARGYYLGVYEAWVEKEIGDRFSLLAGIRDLNSDFYSTESSLGFLNSAFAVGPELSGTGDEGPSIWPKPAPAVRAKADLGRKTYAQVALFNTSGGFGAVEVGWTPRTPAGADSKLAMGAWTYLRHGWGAYVVGDYGLTRQISVFARVGTAQGGISRFGWSGTAGVWANSVFYRGGSVGLGYFHLEHDQDYRAAMVEEGTPVLPGERGLELSYRAELWEGATLQPDLQYIVSPGGAEGAEDAVVAAVRFSVAL